MSFWSNNFNNELQQLVQELRRQGLIHAQLKETRQRKKSAPTNQNMTCFKKPRKVNMFDEFR